MLEQQRLGRDGAHATGAQERRRFMKITSKWIARMRSSRMGCAWDDATMIANVRKTAPHRRIPSYCEFATYRMLRHYCEAA